MNKKLWTPEEELYLSNNYLVKSQKEIALELGRTPYSVEAKAKRLNLVKRRKWTLEEDLFLQKKYISEGIDYCAVALGRTNTSIVHRASLLELKIYTTEYFLSLVEEWLKENKDIVLLDTYTHSKAKLLFKHTTCNHSWYSTINDLKEVRKTGSSGCPKCARRLRYSRAAINWIESFKNPNIRHAENGGEVRIGKYRVDGYDSYTNTIYEFHGDAFHGNLNIYAPEFRCHPYTKEITAEELWQKTYDRMEKLSKAATVIYIWESDYKSGKPYEIF